MKPYDLGTLFDECAERGSGTTGTTGTTVHLDRPFDIARDGRVSYDVPSLAELVRETAGWLAATGAGAGDRVAIIKDNHWDYDLLACAAIRIGAVPALLSGHLPAETLGTLLKRLDPVTLVSNGLLLETARAGDVDLAAFAGVALSLDTRVPGAITVDDVRGHTAPAPRSRHDDEPLVVNHTSGTTGVPKLVVHSTGTIIKRLARLESVRYPVLGVRRSDTVANASSFAHGRTFCWTASVFCLRPREIVILTEPDPALIEPVLREHPPTIMEAVPAAFVRCQPMLTQPDHPFRDVRLFVSTYDAMHPPTVRRYLAGSHRRLPIWMQGWGQTETGPLTFRFLTRRSVAEQRVRHPTTRNLGRPIPIRTRLRVLAPDTFTPVPRGRTGLVFARTKARCLGYVGEEQRWQDKLVGHWWNTGDLGSRTRGGSVLFLDREVDRTPELSCVETEDVLEDRLTAAVECVILGVPGSQPLPVVVTENGELDPDAWSRAVHDLPPLQRPVVLTWEGLPRTGTGKVRRLELLNQLLGRTQTHGSGRWT